MGTARIPVLAGIDYRQRMENLWGGPNLPNTTGPARASRSVGEGTAACPGRLSRGAGKPGGKGKEPLGHG
jgi:hypothetical protein